MDTLLEVRNDVQEKKEALESSLRAAERDFTRRLNELNTGFEVSHLAANQHALALC